MAEMDSPGSQSLKNCIREAEFDKDPDSCEIKNGKGYRV